MIEFLHQKGFTDFDNVIKHDKIDGVRLSQFSNDYLENTLGLTSKGKQDMLLSEIRLASEIRLKKPELYTWGLNNCGQLALNSECNNIAHPK